MPGTGALMIVQSASDVQAIRGDFHDRRLRPFIPAIVLRLALAMVIRFIGDLLSATMHVLTVALFWLLEECLAGCAAYAEAMCPLAAMRNQRSSPVGNEGAAGRCAPAAGRAQLRLVTVAGLVQDSPRARGQIQLPPPGKFGGSRFRDDTSSRQMDTNSSASAGAGRRKNSPQ
jgi:hypothetical protein